jgi:hypothetical protein
MMNVTASAYPWDLANLGIDRVLDDLVEKGIGGIDLSANYHPIDALTPRGGARLFTSPRGAIHFPARAERYGRIRPSLSAPEVCAAWPEVTAKAADRDIDIAAWTITLFQPWIRDAHLDCARRLPSGDPSGSGVCPANADVQEFFTALCADMVDQFGIRNVILESIQPLGYDVDWLRARALVDVSRLANELLMLCFCDTCVARGNAAGLDVAALRQRVQDTIATELDGDVATDPADLAGDEELQAFLSQHEQAGIELVRAAAAGLAGTPATIASSIRTPFSSMRRGVGESLTEQLAEVVHRLSVSPAGGPGNRRIAAIAAAAPHEIELTMLITRGLRFGPQAASAPEVDPLQAQLEEAVAIGVAEVSLYNYGLLRDRDVQLFMDTVRTVAGS